MDKPIKVEPWGKGQGEYVLINAVDFDPAIHTRFGETKRKAKK